MGGTEQELQFLEPIQVCARIGSSKAMTDKLQFSMLSRGLLLSTCLGNWKWKAPDMLGACSAEANPIAFVVAGMAGRHSCPAITDASAVPDSNQYFGLHCAFVLVSLACQTIICLH